MQNALIFIVDNLSDIYIAMFVIRLILQWVRGSYNSVLSQFVMRITAPLVVPARRVLPSVRRVDVPTLVVLLVLECVASLILYVIAGVPLQLDLFVGTVVLRLVSLTLWVYTGAIFIYVILSWVVQGYHPVADALGTLIGPLLRPARRIITPIAGLDLSPMIVLILLQAAIIALPRWPFVP
jgi:YggT family protein